MTAIPLINYLEAEYLSGPPGYLAGTYGEYSGMQVEMIIVDESLTGMNVDMFTGIQPQYGIQAEMIVNSQAEIGMQSLMAVSSPDDDHMEGMQADLQIMDDRHLGMEVRIGKLFHALHPKYLIDSEPYLTTSYLADLMCAFQGMQINAQIISAADDRYEGMQAEMKIDDDFRTGMEVLMRVFDEKNTGMQVNQMRVELTGMQANLFIYNVTQLRILCDFSSRGIDASYNGIPGGDDANWTSQQPLAADDLGKLGNLNTDILEQRVQTADGYTSIWELRCDTGVPNTYVDTLFIGEHNLTRSATAQVQGSDDPSFGTVKFSFDVEINNGFDLINAYYIAPEPPSEPARFFRLLISDPTNPDNHLRIGIICFGSSQIFTPRECFDNPAVYGKRHFKDSVETEGFSNSSNDRATRKRLSLSFTNMRLQGGNFAMLRNYMDEAKTDLKCLIIPYPQRAAALAVFSKLVALPEEQHTASEIHDTDPTKDEWRVSLTLDWDESL